MDYLASLDKYILISKSLKTLDLVKNIGVLNQASGTQYHFGAISPFKEWINEELLVVAKNLTNIIERLGSVYKISNLENYIGYGFYEENERIIPIYTIDHTCEDGKIVTIPLFLGFDHLYAINPYEKLENAFTIICDSNKILDKELFEHFAPEEFNFDISFSEMAIYLREKYSNITDYDHISESHLDGLQKLFDKLQYDKTELVNYMTGEYSDVLDFMPVECVKINTDIENGPKGLLLNRLSKVRTEKGYECKETYEVLNENENTSDLDVVLLFPTANKNTIIKLPEGVYLKNSNTVIDLNLGSIDPEKLSIVANNEEDTAPIVFIQNGVEEKINTDEVVASGESMMSKDTKDKFDVMFNKLLKRLKSIPGIPSAIMKKLKEIYRYFLSIVTNSYRNTEDDMIDRFANEEVYPFLDTIANFSKSLAVGAIAGVALNSFLAGLVIYLIAHRFNTNKYKEVRKRVRHKMEGEIEIINKEIDYAEQRGDYDTVPRLIRSRKMYERILKNIDKESFKDLTNVANVFKK